MSRKKPQIPESIELGNPLKTKFVVKGKRLTEKQKRFLGALHRR